MNCSFVIDSAHNVVSLLTTKKKKLFFDVEFHLCENSFFAIFFIFSFLVIWLLKWLIVQMS